MHIERRRLVEKIRKRPLPEAKKENPLVTLLTIRDDLFKYGGSGASQVDDIIKGLAANQCTEEEAVQRAWKLWERKPVCD